MRKDQFTKMNAMLSYEEVDTISVLFSNLDIMIVWLYNILQQNFFFLIKHKMDKWVSSVILACHTKPSTK